MERTAPEPFVTPPPLEPGDTVGVVAPSRPADSQKLERGLARLRGTFGLEPVVYPTVDRDPERGLAPPAERASELTRAFEDPNVPGVFAYTGGDDQLRVLRHLDADTLRANPTRFFGFSDNDNLRLFLWNAGVVSYGANLHPTLAVDAELHPYVERYLRRALFEESVGTVGPAAEWTDEWFDFDAETPREWRPSDGWDWWRADGDPRSVTGRTWGGTFAILKWHLQVGRHLPSPGALDGAVLVIETSEDVPFPREVGYTLRAMGERGLLERFAGVLVGRPRTYSPELEWEPTFEAYRDELRDVVRRELRRYNPQATAVFGVDYGHTDPSFPLPLGAEVRFGTREDGLIFD